MDKTEIVIMTREQINEAEENWGKVLDYIDELEEKAKRYQKENFRIEGKLMESRRLCAILYLLYLISAMAIVIQIWGLA